MDLRGDLQVLTVFRVKLFHYKVVFIKLYCKLTILILFTAFCSSPPPLSKKGKAKEELSATYKILIKNKNKLKNFSINKDRQPENPAN